MARRAERSSGSSRRAIRRASLALLALVAAAAGIEIAFRGALAVTGRVHDASDLRARLERLLEQCHADVPRPPDAGRADPVDPAEPHLHPYLGWEIAGGAKQLDALLSESARRRRATYDVLVLGGSVAQQFGQFGADRLVQALASDPRLAGRRPRVLGFGRGGFKQPQQANLLVHLLGLGIEPDAVINIDGFNELALGLDNARSYAAHPAYPSAPHWAHLAEAGWRRPELVEPLAAALRSRRSLAELVRTCSAWKLDRSAVAGWLALCRAEHLRADVARQVEAYSSLLLAESTSDARRGPPLRDQDPLDACVRVWLESSRALDGVCRARGIAYLHVLQPTLHDAGSKVLTSSETRDGTAQPAWIEAVQRGYPELRRRGQELRALGVAFCDLSRVFADEPETLYYDACHFHVRGHEILAAAVGAAFLDHLPAGAAAPAHK